MPTSALPLLMAGGGLLAMAVGFIGLGYTLVSMIRLRRRGRTPPRLPR